MQGHAVALKRRIEAERLLRLLTRLDMLFTFSSGTLIVSPEPCESIAAIIEEYRNEFEDIAIEENVPQLQNVFCQS